MVVGEPRDRKVGAVKEDLLQYTGICVKGRNSHPLGMPLALLLDCEMDTRRPRARGVVWDRYQQFWIVPKPLVLRTVNHREMATSRKGLSLYDTHFFRDDKMRRSIATIGTASQQWARQSGTAYTDLLTSFRAGSKKRAERWKAE
jgi:hypothetical protein